MNIYVGNLDYKLNEDELEQVFSQYGEVASVKIIKDRDTGRAKGFAFVDMPNDTEARQAIGGLDGMDFNGRNMKVNEAKPPVKKAHY